MNNFFLHKKRDASAFLDVFTKADAWQLRDWTIERESTTLVGMHTCIYLKSDNLQYDTLAPLGQWDKQTINQASDVPSIFLFHNFL